jgi:hypothetical protein
MRMIRVSLVLFAALWVLIGFKGPTQLIASGGNEKIALEDNCDPRDPAWAPQGCFRRDGTVTRQEFNDFLFSALIPANAAAPRVPIGHPSWRIDPGYLVVEEGETLRVTNAGGRGHTFTEVAAFGGGFVPPLNGGTPAAPGITPAPECLAVAANPPIAPGARIEVTPGVGTHRFQCCIHNWMRAEVKVVAEHDNNHQ